MRRIFVAFGLGLFLLLGTALAAFYQFPFQPAAERVSWQVESALPVRVAIQNLRPGRPFLCRMDAMNVFGSPKSEPSLSLERILVDLSPLSLLSGTVAADCSAEAFGGRIVGTLERGLFDSEYRCDDGRLDWPAFLIDLPEAGIRLQGRLIGNFRFEDRLGASFFGSGNLSLGPGRIQGLKISGLPLEYLEFRKISVDFEVREGRARISRLDLDSSLVRLQMSGGISNPRRPELVLNGEATLGPDGQSPLRSEISISGPLSHPNIRLSGPPRIP